MIAVQITFLINEREIVCTCIDYRACTLEQAHHGTPTNYIWSIVTKKNPPSKLGRSTHVTKKYLASSGEFRQILNDFPPNFA